MTVSYGFSYSNIVISWQLVIILIGMQSWCRSISALYFCVFFSWTVVVTAMTTNLFCDVACRL